MNEDGTDLIGRLIGAAVGETDPDDRTALLERLFAALPAESQERLLREVLDKTASTDQQPSSRRRRPGPRFMWESGADLPLRDIGPWQMCCRMMATIDQAATVAEFDPGLPAEVFGALGDETRIKIIHLLQGEERPAEDIARTLDIPQSTLSHHLRVLRTAGLIRVDRRGRSSFYSLAQPEETP